MSNGIYHDRPARERSGLVFAFAERAHGVPQNRSGSGRYLAIYPLRPASGWVVTFLVIGLTQVPASSGGEVGSASSSCFFICHVLLFIDMFPTILHDHDTHCSFFSYLFPLSFCSTKNLFLIRYDQMFNDLHDYYIPYKIMYIRCYE